MYFPPDTTGQFLTLSVALTGFSEVELAATGMAESYWNKLLSIAGIGIVGDFLSECEAVFQSSGTAAELEAALRERVMTPPKFGPLAQNIISMWYLGQWNRLPREWQDEFGGSTDDQTHIVSSQAYVQSLVWAAFGTHPPAAKAPGYGSWSVPPRILVNTDAPSP